MKPNIKIIKVSKLPTREEYTWSYPIEELDYIFDQIENGDRENGSTFYLYEGRLYESYETEEF